MTLQVVPITQKDAMQWVREVHRHLPPPPGAVFVLSCEDDGRRCGVAIVGRPVARMSCDGLTLEVVRVATDGTPNVNSMLYRAAWTVAKGLGYRRLLTYTLPEEGGASLRAAGFLNLGEAGGGEWSRPSRSRKAAVLSQPKTKWELCAGSGERRTEEG